MRAGSVFSSDLQIVKTSNEPLSESLRSARSVCGSKRNDSGGIWKIQEDSVLAYLKRLCKHCVDKSDALFFFSSYSF